MRSEPTDLAAPGNTASWTEHRRTLLGALYFVFTEQEQYAVRLRGLLNLSMHERLCIFHLLMNGPTNMTELSRRLCLSGGAITGIAERLGRLGYVERVRDDRDKRRYQLCPTPRVGELYAELTRPLSEMVRSFETRAEARDLEVVMHFLDYMRRAYERAIDQLEAADGRLDGLRPAVADPE